MSRADYTKGNLTLYGNMLIESSDIYDGRLESVFGDKNQNISFGELISKTSKVGIEPQKLADEIKESSNEFLKQWLEYSGYDSCWTKTSFEEFEVVDIRVTWQFIDIDFKSYCKFDIYTDVSNFDDWEEFDKILSDAADETMKHNCREISYDDYDFITGIDYDVEIEYDGSPAAPPDYDEHDSVLYNEWYG